jgi:transaldolase / glucose-6-phosphate isomerase
MSTLQSLQHYGQSVWLDYLRRSLITSGELKRLIEEEGVRGLTSNPSIFEKSIAESSDYRSVLEAPESQGLDSKTLYERIAVRDVQDAADVLRPVFEESKRRDGYVSLEVDPIFAFDTQGTIEEARRLWLTVARGNLMIKVPATPEGIPAVRQLITEGINVNVTLLFTQETYERVAAAYLDGLDGFAQRGGDLGNVASVASFFISRIDSSVDTWIVEHLNAVRDPEEQAMFRSLLGKVAVASAKNTYREYLQIVQGNRWQNLSRQGAQTQRLLWASTGTKNPSYSDVLYVEELIGPDTVNTIPPATLAAFREHGRARPALTGNVEEAVSIMDLVKRMGIPFQELTDKLLADGVTQFADAFVRLLKAIGGNSGEPAPGSSDLLKLKLLKELHKGRHQP